MTRPSGDQMGNDATPGVLNCAKARGFEPSTGTIQMSRSSSSLRLDTTATDLPSGEKTGSISSQLPLVSCFGFPPAAGISQILSQPLSCSDNARVLPSGDHSARLSDQPPPRSCGAV